MLQGTKLNMAIKGLSFGTLSKTLLNLHQQARDMAKLEPQEHKTLLAVSRRAKRWQPIETHDELGNVLIDFSHSNPGDFDVKGKEDKEEITELMADMAVKDGSRTFAKLKRA